jgi:glyoxylase-like metal-dependent hydrolase (beta-lactamase superfamily II)
MKRLHRDDLYAWSAFDEARDIDFNALAWVRPSGNVLVDPLPMTAHDRSHLAKLGGAALVVVTNSDHTRAAAALAKELDAKIAGPRAERSSFPLKCDLWIGDGDEIVPGLVAFELEGSKTPGELALCLEEGTLIFGDLVRAHRAGALMFLQAEKLKDKARAVASVRRVAEGRGNDAVLVGDGFSGFREGRVLLDELLEREDLQPPPAARRSGEDSGQFKIPQSRTSIPVPRAGSACSYCGRSAHDHRLVSGTAVSRREPSAICAPCAARLAAGATAARCDFCQQDATQTAREKETTICKDCLDLAVAIFGDADA